jgi:hypothetical protein
MLAVTTVVLIGLLVLFFFDPARHSFYPFCLFKKVTGYDCPGCGGLRALHELLRGDIGGAFRLNALVVVALPAVMIWLAWRWRKQGQSRPLSGRTVLVLAWVLTMGLVLFGILRNLPLWPFGVTPG